MKKPVFIATSGFVVFIVLFMSAFYLLNFPEKIIFDRIKAGTDYSLHRVEEPVHIKVFIKPEWVNVKEDKQENYDIELVQLHSTGINLDYVMNRGQDLYFNFRPKYRFKESEGEFLHNDIINGDGTITSGMRFEDIKLYDERNKEIMAGQTGAGPDADFSFSIEQEDWDSIKNGFYVEYSGYYLYKYVRN